MLYRIFSFLFFGLFNAILFLDEETIFLSRKHSVLGNSLTITDVMEQVIIDSGKYNKETNKTGLLNIPLQLADLKAPLSIKLSKDEQKATRNAFRNEIEKTLDSEATLKVSYIRTNLSKITCFGLKKLDCFGYKISGEKRDSYSFIFLLKDEPEIKKPEIKKPEIKKQPKAQQPNN